MARFGALAVEWGMDEDAKWLMVPDGGFNLVLLHDGAGLNLKCSGGQCIDISELNNPCNDAAQKILRNPSVKNLAMMWENMLKDLFTLVMDSSTRLIVVAGSKPGNTVLQAIDKKSGRIDTSLAVSVLKQRTVNVTFNFVRHTKDDKTILNHFKTSSEGDVAKWVAYLNHVYTPQANLVFKTKGPRKSLVKKHLDAVLTSKDWNDIVGDKDTNADWNVFIVGKWEHEKRAVDYSARTGTTDGKRNSVCDDEPRSSGQDPLEVVIAHEGIHACSSPMLGHPEGSLHPDWLSQTDGIRTGRKIPKEHVRLMNSF